MSVVTFVLSPPIAADLLDEVREKLVYASSSVTHHEIADDGATVTLTVREGAAPAEAENRVRELVARMVRRHHAVETVTVFENRVASPRAASASIWSELETQRAVSMPTPGLATLTGDAVDVLEALDHRFWGIAQQTFGARRHHYPSLLAKSSLDRIRYFGSFPHHVSFALRVREDLEAIEQLAGKEVDAGSEAFLALLQRPPLVLAPAGCFHTYVHHQDRPLEQDTVITGRMKCFRYESRNMKTLERLWEFTMREIVFLGTDEWVKEKRSLAVDAVGELVRELGLDGWIETANDPFFINNFSAQRFFQRASQTKYELRLSLPYAGPGASVAASSFNLHLDFFGKSFGISAPAREDAFVHTGCVGFGLERWTWALFAQFGPDVAAWPAATRAALGLDVRVARPE